MLFKLQQVSHKVSENESMWRKVVFGVTQAVDQILKRSVTLQLLFVIRVFQIQYSVRSHFQVCSSFKCAGG
jgi:hypothetical protein